MTPTIQEEGELNIKQNLKGDVMVLNLSGKIMGGPDHEKFQTEIKTLISDGYVDILLDMHKVSWVNSTGLGILVSAYHTLKKNGGQLKICQVSDRIDNILNVTQLKLVFETFENCDEALTSFEQV
jgi:anti-sigma B factor antagonist